MGLGFTVPGDTWRKTNVGRDWTNVVRPSEKEVVGFLPCHTGILAGCAAVAVFHRADPLQILVLLSQSCSLPPPIQSNWVTPWLGTGRACPVMNVIYQMRKPRWGQAALGRCQWSAGHSLRSVKWWALMSFGRGRTSIGCVSSNWISSFLPSPLPYWVA